MMRRSRISVRPNVRPGVRALTSQDAPSSQAAVHMTQVSEREGNQSVTTENTQAGDKPSESVPSSESISPDMRNTGQSFQNSGDATACVLQRRKRFSAMPNLAKPRVAIASSRAAIRVLKSPLPEVSNMPPAEAVGLSPKENGAQGLRSPRWRRASGGGKPSKIQGKLALLSSSVPASANQAPLSSAVPAPGPVPRGREKEMSVPLQCSKTSDLEKSSQKQIPLPDTSPISVMQSQSAKLEMKTSSLPQATQGIPSDRERIAKLRELLKQERRKQRKQRKGRSHICEHSIPRDHNKMTMRDLIYYLPVSNPMKSYPGEENRLAEKVIPLSPNKELPEKPRDLGEEDEEQENEDHDDEPAGEDQLVVPRVKVAEDGTLILDEESLTVEVLRTKGPNLAEENDPIFERGSSTTYSSFRKTVYTKPWSNKETEMFFMAISMVGTDFSLIGELFPHRARTEIKNKFKKEERENSWRIDKAFKEKCRFDLEFFSKHLERVLAEEQRKRKKSKTKDSVGQKIKTSIPKGKKAAAQQAPGDQSATEELDSDVVEGDSETAEKENEDCTNVGETGAITATAKNGLKRKSREGEETPHEKSADGRSMKKSRTEDEGALSDDCEGSVCYVQPAAPDVNRLKKPDSSIRGWEGPEIKPAQLCRGRFQRPTPTLGARLAKKAPRPGEKSGDGDVENSSSEEGGLSAALEQNVNRPARRGPEHAKKDDSVRKSSSASLSHPKGLAAVGRAKPRPNLPTAPRSSRAGKPQLVTLRASLPEDNDEEEQDETHPEEDFRYPINPEEQNQAPAFVPVSLRSPQPVPMEVVETMEELEISMNVSDAVGTAESEHAFCSQPVCPGAQDVVVMSTEHQLDLLVDVIEFLSPDHVAGSEESCNEAARTLLTIRNPELLSLAAPAYSREVIITEDSHHVQLEETDPSESLASEAADQLLCSTQQPQVVPSDLPVAQTSLSDSQSTHDLHSISLTPVEEFESETAGTGPILKAQFREGQGLKHTAVPEESQSQESAAPASSADTHSGALSPKVSVQNVLLGRRGRFPKPKPNLVRTARTPRAAPAQCTEKSAAVAPLESEALRTVEVEKKAMGCSAKGQVHETQESKGFGEDMSSQVEAPRVGDSQGDGSSSDLSEQSLPPAGWSGCLLKLRPVLDRAVLDPCVSLPLSTPVAPSTGGDQRRPLGDTKATKLTEEASAGSADGMRDGENKGNTSAEVRMAEGQAKTNPLVEVEEVNEASNVATLKEPCPEDGGDRTHETSVSIDTIQEATSLHMDGDLGTAISCQATGVQQPTFILTLFEVTPPLLGELDSGVDPPGTITAELLSPLVFVDEQLAPPPAQTDTHSCDPLNVASEEMGTEHGRVSHPLPPASEEQEERSGHDSMWEGTDSSTGVTSNIMASPVDSCERIGLTLLPSEEPHCPEAEVEGTGETASPLKKRNTPVRAGRDHLWVKPNSSAQKPEVPTEGVQTIFRTEHLPSTPDQTSLQASSPHSSPRHPASQHTSTDAPAAPGLSTTDDPPQGIVGCPDHLALDRESISIAEGTGSNGVAIKHQISQQALPVTPSGLATRTGRRPKGFLSFITDKSNARPAGAPRSIRPTCLRPQVNTSRPGRRTPTVGTPPSRAISADGQTAANSAASTSAEEESSVSKTDKEPTSVSEYFFSDIFTQVEEPE